MWHTRAFLLAFTCNSLLAGALSAQDQPGARAPDTAVVRLFDAGAVLTWQRYFHGTIDDVHPVVFSLASDGTSCQGYLYYATSGERVRLQGTLQAYKTLELIEFTPDGQPCGLWVGRVANGNLQAEWRSVDQIRGAYAEAAERPYRSYASQTADDAPLFMRFTGTQAGRPVELLLLRTAGRQVQGVLQLHVAEQSLNVRGRVESDSLLSLYTVRADNGAAIRLDGVLKARQALRLRWNDATGRRELLFRPGGDMPALTDHWADFQVRWELVYPKTPCTDCNRWFERHLEAWHHQLSKGSDTGVRDRNRFQATGWVDLMSWNEQMLSGLLFLQTPRDSMPSGYAFSFDLHKKKVLDPERIFRMEGDWAMVIDGLVEATWAKWPKAAADPAFRQWLQTDGFPLRVIHPEGLLLSTSFHPVYGRYQVMAPFEELEPFLNRKKDKKYFKNPEDQSP